MNVTELIASVKLKGAFPEDNYFTNGEYLSFLNDQLKIDIVPLLMRLNDEYFLAEKEYSISSGSTYRVPKRAIGAKLRDVKIKDSSGNYRNLLRLYEEDRQNSPTGYYIKKNSIELSSDITSGTLVLSYFVTPSTLVPTANCGQITSIDPALNQVVIGSAPSTFANDVLIDFIQNGNPYDSLGIDVSISSISGTTVTFTELPDGLEIGDWIAVAGQSPVPQIPEELHPVLVQCALVACLSSKKDKAAEFETQKLMMMKESFINMMDPRVESNDRKLRPSGLLSHFRLR